MRKTLQGLLAFLALLLLASCFGKSLSNSNWPTYQAKPGKMEAMQIPPADEIVRALNHKNARPVQLQTAYLKIVLHFIKTREDSPGKTETLSLDGDLLMEKPNHIRLRTYLPLGSIGSDLLYHDKEVEIYLPERRELNVISSDHLKNLKLGDITLKLPKPEDWWRLIEPWRVSPEVPSSSINAPAPSATPPVAKGAKPDDELLDLVPTPVTSDSHTGLLMKGNEQYFFDWQTGRITRLIQANSSESIELIYSDWKQFNNRDYAATVKTRFEDADKKSHLTLNIDIKEIEENPPLGPEAFKSVDAKNLKVRHLN